MNILLVEDEKSLAETIISYLSRENYHCEWVDNYVQAVSKINVYAYDCFLIDIGLPDGSGLDLIKEIKHLKLKSGLLIISARDSIDDRIAGLDLGADDYITKPFDLSELNARIKAVIRRRNYDGFETIQFNELVISPYERWLKVNGKMANLTKKEFDLILFFVSNINRVITKETIAEHLWGDHMDNADSFDFLYAHFKNLRKKILELGGEDYIQTVHGVGYKFTKL